jgi:hypothetical protein
MILLPRRRPRPLAGPMELPLTLGVVGVIHGRPEEVLLHCRVRVCIWLFGDPIRRLEPVVEPLPKGTRVDALTKKTLLNDVYRHPNHRTVRQAALRRLVFSSCLQHGVMTPAATARFPERARVDVVDGVIVLRPPEFGGSRRQAKT